MPKKLKYLSILLLSVFTINIEAQSNFYNPIKLSNQAEISILTIDRADEELFQAFGHICIYVYDPVNQIDRVYSYGSFDFSTENFYWKFITGRLPYQISLSNLHYTLLEYSEQYENRSVVKQELNLSEAQKQRVFDILEENLLPENKTYQYKFFQDNCSTRIRDVFKKAMGDSLKFSRKGYEQGHTFRYWMNKNLPNTPLAKFGMNLAIGNPSDKRLTNEEAMYIPDNMRINFDNATNGGQKLVKKTFPLFTANRPNQQNRNTDFSQPNVFIQFLIGLLPFLIIFLSSKLIFKFSEKMNSIILKSIFLITGLVGIVIVFLWFFTQHGVTTSNWNLLWAWPTNLIALFFINKASRNIKIYQFAYLIAVFIAFLLGSFSFFWENIYPKELMFVFLFFFIFIGTYYFSKSEKSNFFSIK